MTLNDSRPPERERRWYQFSLRTLLVLLLFGSSLLLGWFLAMLGLGPLSIGSCIGLGQAK